MEEQLEFVMICLQCLHVGCTMKKMKHAEEHFINNPEHYIARGIVGRLHCYKCDQDIEVDEKSKENISKIEILFDLAICGPAESKQPQQVPGIFSSEIKN